MELSTHIIQPRECILAICIPSSRQSFVANLNSGNCIDFTRRTLYKMYVKEFLKPSCGVTRSIAKKGVTVFENCTLTDFKLILQMDFKALVIFAHYTKDSLEFYDGLYDIKTVNSLIPADKQFILDLNVCHCDDFGMLVTATKKYVLVKMGRCRKTIPLKWLLLYEYLFELIRQKRLTYFDAVEISQTKFLNSFQHDNK